MIRVTADVSDALVNQFELVASQYDRNRASHLREIMKNEVNAFKKKYPQRWKAAVEGVEEHLDIEDAVSLREEIL